MGRIPLLRSGSLPCRLAVGSVLRSRFVLSATRPPYRQLTRSRIYIKKAVREQLAPQPLDYEKPTNKYYRFPAMPKFILNDYCIFSTFVFKFINQWNAAVCLSVVCIDCLYCKETNTFVCGEHQKSENVQFKCTIQKR